MAFQKILYGLLAGAKLDPETVAAEPGGPEDGVTPTESNLGAARPDWTCAGPKSVIHAASPIPNINRGMRPDAVHIVVTPLALAVGVKTVFA
jgi:hypothetical protein